MAQYYPTNRGGKKYSFKPELLRHSEFERGWPDWL